MNEFGINICFMLIVFIVTLVTAGVIVVFRFNGMEFEYKVRFKINQRDPVAVAKE